MSLVSVNAQDAPILALVIDRSFTEPMLSFYIPFPFRVSFPFPPDYTVVSRLDVFGTALALKILHIYMLWEFWKGKEDG